MEWLTRPGIKTRERRPGECSFAGDGFFMQKLGQSGAKRSIYRLMFTPGQFNSFCEKARFGVLFSMKSTRRVNEILLRSVKALQQWVDFTQNTAKAQTQPF